MLSLKSIFIFTIIIYTNLILITSVPTEDLVKNLPNFPYQKDIYSGYLDTSKPERKLHYVFVPSQSDIVKDPLVVWFNGGPGCSSLEGFISEHGPAVFNDFETTIKLNEFSWNKNANMLYIESPAGVGFSYTTLGKQDYASDDEKSAVDNLQALLSFRKKFPEYESNDFYISGESYAGIYVPHLATKVLEDTTFKSFKGIIIGNGVTDWNYEVEKSLLDFAYGHYLITEDMVKDYYKNCVLSTSSFLQNFKVPINCINAKKRVKASLEGLNIYDVFRICPKDTLNEFSDSKNTSSMASTINLLKKVSSLQKQKAYGEFYNEFADPLDVSMWPSSCKDNTAIDDYLNTDAVKDALHVKKDIKWAVCNPEVSDSYNIDLKGSFYLYANIIKNGIKILFFTGDSDAAVPFTGSIKWINNLKLPIKTPYASWMINNQVVGFTQEYEGLTFTTIKGTGHMSPAWKREECFTMFNNFIKNK